VDHTAGGGKGRGSKKGEKKEMEDGLPAMIAAQEATTGNLVGAFEGEKP